MVLEDEENWKFRLTAYKDRLRDWLSKPECTFFPSFLPVFCTRTSRRREYTAIRQMLKRFIAIWPNVYRQTLLRQLDTIEDLSVSRPRSRVQWGVPVPGDDEQTMYVWVDALVNYLTVLGYPSLANTNTSPTPTPEGWPCDVQVIGKDIVK